MINKLYDFRDVAIPDALLNASVSREEIDGELRLTAQRFTTIAPAFDGICNGDIVVLEIPDEQYPDGVQQVFVNMGRGFFDSEEALLGLCAGAQTADDCRRALNEMCEEQVKLAALGRHYARQDGIEYTREESIARMQAYMSRPGQTEISEAEENMIAVDIIRRYADYFQKVISDYYKDKIRVVIQ